MPRASGKTTLLIKESAKTGKPIITATCFAADNIRQMAKDMGADIPKPMSATSWPSGCCSNGRFNRIDGVLIDELDSVLRSIFGVSIDKVTYTPKQLPRHEYTNQEKIDMFKIIYNRLGIVWENLENEFENIKKKTANKVSSSKSFYRPMKDTDHMKEFNKLLDDINKALDNLEKNISEMEKLNMVANDWTKFYKTYEPCITGMDISNYGSGSCTLDISMLDYLGKVEYEKSNIIDINVIVPDKVVEITFGDGKEKMVCHEDDTFDLRKCCFIAIAKHLYKKEYTQEGIEYMATQLTYKKKYVKIVDKALRGYWKKEEEKEKRIREERKREEIQEHQREKRRRYKERRTQRYKEVMIDLIADSINEAKVRRKANK